ncbi:MAG: pyridoxamine 5'-phosphate oxidase family protein [Xanthomonadales bacterium]|nr:pyridoxamine 5'-phosphate oxidase family protein [Xanthomonadales bacterium]NIN33455.1 pyridoxamine 5'-phosphate oxidase family protein [Hydrogenophaga sp.]NIN59977.1 pyridoxamine 5'-phosphate oxidase family protein [Xanthomonadales bacterium]NIN75350.1 pyridoxamine 5'-phosphate oxidase family protein [Xanthomonadales bacterium]NIO13519.1 pyridoxamine 5'-phosphate oxidase family protein [Xanthomonadales bacterium]
MNPMQADTRLRRLPERGGRDFDEACRIIDAAKLCHVGVHLDGQPYVLPMACARQGRDLLLHGSVASRLVRHLADGHPCCVTVTHLDGLVLARSAFHSSMNYRCLMLFGRARLVAEPAARSAGLDALVEHLLPGRLADLRPPTRKELNATALLSVPIETFTTKVRSGPPEDPASDVGLPAWAGVVPLATVAGSAQDAPDLATGTARPAYLEDY